MPRHERATDSTPHTPPEGGDSGFDPRPPEAPPAFVKVKELDQPVSELADRVIDTSRGRMTMRQLLEFALGAESPATEDQRPVLQSPDLNVGRLLVIMQSILRFHAAGAAHIPRLF